MSLEMVVAANLKRLRKARGLTQEQLALQAEIAMRYIGMIERAQTSATVGMLARLATALAVHPGAFFTDL